MQISDINGKVRLRNGVEMPYLGLGVYKAKDGAEVINSVGHALEHGYRLIDTASFYENEAGVGEAIKNSGIPRKEIFVTTKIWIDDQGEESTREAFETSLYKLDMDYVDLYLIHWPVPGKFLDTWQIIQELYEEGKARAIGVSNCLIHHLESIKQFGGVEPMVLQNEFHPRLVQQEILEYCENNNILYQAWSPLMRGEILTNPVIKDLAKRYSKSPAQIVIRWDLQKGVASIPKSVHKERIIENSKVFDFDLRAEEIALIDSLENDTRTGAHPDHFMEHFQKKP
ncbi:aldo/keto reductase [Gramella jeungdoensis]|uniref:Aldo/keto reductase n=1 Tax=Gramella jeungdoensis TaxID=708091 RepID=A0ABT0YY50_9FLAO|nr:aldo/keto reductase [Gramella jeungdoensis]MCM8568402.1 aldo/keto reductase [Gramella jeungdoensis]